MKKKVIQAEDDTTPDASNGILGGTLMQLDEEGIERPIAYASTMLSKTEKNYGITHTEGLGVTWAMKKWAQYLHNNVPLR